MKLLHGWDAPIDRILQCLADDNVQVAGTFPYDTIDQVQNFASGSKRPHRAIMDVLDRAMKGSIGVSRVDFVTAIFNRLQRDENALNWVMHSALSQCHVAGNDERLIRVIKALHPACKLVLVAALRGLDSVFQGELPYAANLDPALRQLADLCNHPENRSFKILPTDNSMSTGATMTWGDPGITAINVNASVVHTLPRTVLARIHIGKSYAASISEETKAKIGSFPMAAGLQYQVMEECWSELNVSTCIEKTVMSDKSVASRAPGALGQFFRMENALSHAVDRLYKGMVTVKDLTQEPSPVLGGFYQNERTAHVKFEKILNPQAWDDQQARQRFLQQIARLYGMAQLSDSNFSVQSTGKTGYENELVMTPGIPGINNFLKDTADQLDIFKIDDQLDQHGEILISSCAHHYAGISETNLQMAHSFLLRLALGSKEKPSNVFFEYGLMRLALSCKEYLHKHLGIDVVDQGIDEFCDLLGLDVLGDDDVYQFSQKTKVFSMLPDRFHTADNKLMLGIALSPAEIELASDSEQERSLVLDLGL